VVSLWNHNKVGTKEYDKYCPNWIFTMGNHGWGLEGWRSGVTYNFLGQLITVAGTGKAGFADGVGKAAQFDGPEGIAVLESDGSVLVADKANNRIRQISSDGISSPFPTFFFLHNLPYSILGKLFVFFLACFRCPN
jgi:hypothetical protein